MNIYLKSQGVLQVNNLGQRGSADKRVWRPLVYGIKVRRERALGDVRSLIALAVLWWHTDRSSSAASSPTHLSSLQRKHQVGTLQCCQVRGLPPKTWLLAPGVWILLGKPRKNMYFTRWNATFTGGPLSKREWASFE